MSKRGGGADEQTIDVFVLASDGAVGALKRPCASFFYTTYAGYGMGADIEVRVPSAAARIRWSRSCGILGLIYQSLNPYNKGDGK